MDDDEFIAFANSRIANMANDAGRTYDSYTASERWHIYTVVWSEWPYVRLPAAPHKPIKYDGE